LTARRLLIYAAVLIVACWLALTGFWFLFGYGSGQGSIESPPVKIDD
jgi:hypothetical protein